MTRPRIVGIDYGTKRTGIALADPLRTFAQPYGAFPPDDIVEELRSISEEDGIELIVVGWPLTPEGKVGDAADRVQQFINRLQNAFPGVQIVKQDERHSSEMAKDAMRSAGRTLRQSDPKERLDAAAASIILQDYLDAQG